MHPCPPLFERDFASYVALSILSGPSLPISFNIYCEMYLDKKSTWLICHFWVALPHTAMSPPMGYKPSYRVPTFKDVNDSCDVLSIL